jgi:branched-chain amino acid transport system substrate-binding protein
MPEGITPAKVIVDALQKIGPNPTREKLADALANTNLDTGITAGPIVFTPTDHAGQKAAIYMKFDGERETLLPGVYRSSWTYTPSVK